MAFLLAHWFFGNLNEHTVDGQKNQEKEVDGQKDQYLFS